MSATPTTESRPLPPTAADSQMTSDIDGAPEMREAECPYCERPVLVYEDPPRCPLCACPIDGGRMHPFAWPDEEPSTS